MLSTAQNSNDRARIFVGAYGKGKSHLALVLLALLSRKDKALYSDVLSMICQTKPELCSYILKYQESNQKMLPVVIQGSSVGIRQSMLLGLKKALQEAGLGDIMPSTYYGAAIKTIENWQEKYNDTFNKFKNLISCTVDEFKAELNNFNTKYYQEFVSLYPVLTSGSEFNPINGIAIHELYTEVNEKIQKYGYTGIFVVYDEFSKFLSGNLKNTDTDEIEVLQYFAEACSRSGKKQMHIMLISHQSILNYVDKLSKAKINSWKAVSQRYKSVELNTSAAQMYDLTAHVIKKEPVWYDEFLCNHAVAFEKVYNKWKDKRLFAELTESQYKNLIYDCYPLEPITSFVLPEISEKIAQNERTLFTFLSAEGQRHTLPMYLANTEIKDVPFLTPDYVYDYFESLFKADSYDRLTHKYWKIVSSALNKVDKSHDLERRMIKTLALIYIVDRFELLAPTVDTIISIYNSNHNDAKDIIPALTYLTDSGIIRKIEGKDHLKITEYTGKPVDTLIEDALIKRSSLVKIEETLNQFCGDKVIYPNAYNDDNEIVRYFNFKFRFDLHAKTYIFDKKRYILGSGNLTSRGLGLNCLGNYELADFSQIEGDDLFKIESLFSSAILMTDELYSSMKEDIVKFPKVSVNEAKALNWDKYISDRFEPDTSVLFTYDFPQVSAPSSEVDEYEFLELSGISDKERIKQAFRWSKAFLWLYKTVNEKENKECYFGELSAKLHNALINDPKPYRKEVKDLLSNLLGWIEYFDFDFIKVDRPNHSQRVRFI